MQVNSAVIIRSRVCPQDKNGDPAWSENLYTPISNKLPPGKPFTFIASTLQHLPLQHLLFGDFTIAIFPFSTTPCFEFVGLHQLISGKLVSTILPNNPRL
jgi:hypothetical protein